MNVFTKNKSSKKIYLYEESCGENTFTRHQTRARKRSLRNDRTRVALGRYVATELEPLTVVTLGRCVATELKPSPVATYRPSVRSARSLRSDRARAKPSRYVATERPFRSVAT
ncbi:hypothetical protein F2Q69_00027759 [Brassica cretica]|uniref:Uncharacterized protein n=1 Tax=Brassica cretica TaxID=69181 RepID=A0A8S9RRX1_BRACR|nr:hypothetical protein F2Q69_00027759 [Brassica cretica]